MAGTLTNLRAYLALDQVLKHRSYGISIFFLFAIAQTNVENSPQKV
jgi:hypothetical protein